MDFRIRDTPLVDLARITRDVDGRILAKLEYFNPGFSKIDIFCDFVGTGGSFAGCTTAFKEHNPSVECFVVEPEGAAILAGVPVTYPNHRIQGVATPC